MANVDLSGVGINKEVSLEGDVTVCPGTGPVLFLLAESHADNNAIGQNLRSAINLLDAEVVEVVGVEQYCSPTDIKAELLSKPNVKKEGSLAAYSAGLLKDLKGDSGVIGAVKGMTGRALFGDNLVYLRPGVKIVGVEDPALREEAQKASEAVAGLFPEEEDSAKRKKLQIAKFREDGVERELKRDAAFVSNVLKAREEAGSERAAAINGGGKHIKRIAEKLKEEGKAHVLIIPEGYKEAL